MRVIIDDKVVKDDGRGLRKHKVTVKTTSPKSWLFERVVKWLFKFHDKSNFMSFDLKRRGNSATYYYTEDTGD